MAAREGQGLQIAVIIFAMLTIILAITTYIFYAQSQTAYKEKEDAVAQKNQAQTEANKSMYRVRAFQYVLGLQGAGLKEVEDAKSRAGGDDAEVTEILGNFKSDMDAIASHAAQDQVKNYRTMPMILLAAINKKNASVADANDTITKAHADKDALEKREKNRADVAEAAVKTATDALNTEKTGYATSLKTIDDKVAVVKAEVDKNIKDSRSKQDGLEKEVSILQADAVKLRETVAIEKEKRKELQAEGTANLFETADGKVAWVNQKQQLVWIDVGRADGLMRQTTFAVFDHDANGVTKTAPKARLEVVRVSDEHMAECKILEDTPANPILPGDAIHTPTWSPGQRIHFAMAGVMDIDENKSDDYEMVRNIITSNGGLIDAEVKPDGTRAGKLTVNTRYFVLGEPPDEKSTAKAQEEFSKLKSESDISGTDRISVQDLLTQMGWKSEQRTVELAGGGGGQFRSRKPGQKAAAPKPAGETPEAAPMPEGGAPAADPFAAPAADPFADPKPMPMPATPAAGEADPFATPE